MEVKTDEQFVTDATLIEDFDTRPLQNLLGLQYSQHAVHVRWSQLCNIVAQRRRWRRRRGVKGSGDVCSSLHLLLLLLLTGSPVSSSDSRTESGCRLIDGGRGDGVQTEPAAGVLCASLCLEPSDFALALSHVEARQ